MRVKDGRLEMILESLRISESRFNKADKENSRLENELKKQTDKVSELKIQLADKPNDIVDRKTVEDLFRKKWQTLNVLCEEYFEKWDDEKTRRTILNKLRKEVDKQTSPDRLADIEQSVDMYMGGIMSLLRKEFPDFKPEDLNLMTLIFAGLSHRASCLFMGFSNTQYYKKRSRLKNIIKSSQAPHRDLFLEKFEKLNY